MELSAGVFVFVACLWRSEDRCWVSVLSSHHVHPRDGTRVVRLEAGLYFKVTSNKSTKMWTFLLLNLL